MVFLAPTRAKHRRAGKPSRPAKRADLAGLAPPGGAYCFRVDDTVFGGVALSMKILSASMWSKLEIKEYLITKLS